MAETVGNGAQPVTLTKEGGLAYWVVNKTGEVSVRGKIVEPGDAIDNSVVLISPDDADPIGVIYDAGVADGGMMRIVFSGRAEVLFGNTPIRHYFARNSVAVEAIASGLAFAEPMPAPPLSTDKHFLEIGHILETKGAPGLALVNLHFN